MTDVETRLGRLPEQVAGAGPTLQSIEARAGRLVRRRRVVRSVVAVSAVAVVVAVGAVVVSGVRSPVDLIIGEGGDSGVAQPPADQLHNPGVLDVEVPGGRLVATLEVVPHEVPAPGDVRDMLDPDATEDVYEGPWWILRNAPDSDVRFEYGFGMVLERWSGDSWQRLGPLPVGMSAVSLEPGRQDRQTLALAHIPAFDAFIEASTDSDPHAVFDAIAPLEPGWYRATKSITVLTDYDVPQPSLQLRATFHVTVPDERSPDDVPG